MTLASDEFAGTVLPTNRAQLHRRQLTVFVIVVPLRSRSLVQNAALWAESGELDSQRVQQRTALA